MNQKPSVKKASDHTTKYCPGCDCMLAVESFSKDKYQKSGLRCRCKECSAGEFKAWQSTPGYSKRLALGKQKRHTLKKKNPKMRWAEYSRNAALMRSRKHGVPCTLTQEWLYEAAPTVCPLLGIPLRFDNEHSLANSASMDRVDPQQGYTPENCRIISMKANRIKTNATKAELVTLAKNLETYY